MLKRLLKENRAEDYSPTFVGDDGGGGLPDRLGDPPAQLLNVLLELLLVHLALEDEYISNAPGTDLQKARAGMPPVRAESAALSRVAAGRS